MKPQCCHPEGMMHVRIEKDQAWCAVVVTGARSPESFRQIHRRIYELVNTGFSHVVVKFDGTGILDLPSVKFLCRTADFLSFKEGGLYLIRPNTQIERQFLQNRRIRILHNDFNQKLPLSFGFLFEEQLTLEEP